MANRPHVPKFGDWNNQDQPFTVVFDNARTNKRQDLYESLEKPETNPPAKVAPPPQPQPAPRPQRPEPPRQVRDDTSRARPPQPDRINKVKAPPADQLYGGGGGGGGGGLYGGYAAGGGSGNQRPSQTPPRPVQTKPNRGGNNGRGGTTIPPFPGSVGSGENMSYTHIFDQVKEERREGARSSYGGSTGNTPSRPINNQYGSPAPKSSTGCCFPWGRRGSKY